MLTTLLLLIIQTSPAEEMAQLLPTLKAAQEKYVKEARQLSGTVSIYDVAGTRNLLQGQVVKSNTGNYMMQIINASGKPTRAELYRQFGDIRQRVILNSIRNSFKITEEQFSKKGEKAFDIDTTPVFVRESPSCISLRLAPSVPYTLVDALAYPAFEVTKVEHTAIGTEKVIKISYRIDKEKNDNALNKMSGLTGGWVAVRPDHQYTVYQAEYTVPADRRRPARSWKAEYVYEPGSGFPALKEIRLATTDQTDKGDLKLAKQLYEFNFKQAQGLTDKDFSLTQFGVKEHTATEWLAEEAAREKAEAEEKAKIDALPPDAIKLVSDGIQINPWVILVSGVVGFILLVIWVFWVTTRSKRVVNS